MPHLHSLLMLLLLLLLHSLNHSAQSLHFAKDNEFTSTVSLEHFGSSLCTGALLSNRSVLIASSCLQRSTTDTFSLGDLSVVAGVRDLRDVGTNGGDGQRVGVSKVTRHPDLVTELHGVRGADLAVLTLSESVKVTQSVKFVTLSDKNSTQATHGTECQLVSWFPLPKMIPSLLHPRLRVSTVNIISDEVCSRYFSRALGNDGIMCGVNGDKLINSEENFIRLAQLLFCHNQQQQQLELYGVSSMAKREKLNGSLLDVITFSRIAAVRDWIDSVKQ